ncbi:leupaxin isoform X2 [Chironomus tepperi]|uniref:leupaxin isoform X2 n=1 Tax=Chironomus tepperi TaxID=113505 RepID=UPI00391F518B
MTKFSDALLADLQNTVVPSGNANSYKNVDNNTSGYGCLKGVKKKEVSYNNGDSHSQASVQQKVVYNNTMQSPASGNLNELDSLLNDLSNARYGGGFEKKHQQNSLKDSGISQDIIDQIQRPSVDTLLDELNVRSTSPVYAVPHDEKPKSGRHVTITVKQTTTERVEGNPSQINAHNSYSTSASALGHNASSATKELDDLMASLSDFKINPSHQQTSVTDYAKPTKGISHYQVGEETVVETTYGREPRRDQLELMLGNLQADMSRQGVNTQQKGCCSGCEKPIVGQVITALGKQWHPEHFTCNHCNQELGTRNFFERDGNPYCEADYHNLFSPRCSYCNGPILDKCVTALDKTWHTEHFFCAQCGQQFGDEGFHERDGKPYCRKDYFDMFAPRCAGCNQAIMENYISALNSQFHPDCFVCRDCRQPFYGGSFFDHEGMPYCETHYHAKRGSLCAGCSKPITGRCITAMFRKFHPEHFVCAFCLKQLNKGTFKEQNDKPFCAPCFEKLFG